MTTTKTPSAGLSTTLAELPGHAGEHLGSTAWRTVTQDQVDAFADLTEDHNPIHVDPDFARSTPFRRCIAHGLLGLSVASGLAATTPPARTAAFLGIREWHFRAPVYAGDEIRVLTRVVGKRPRGRGRRGEVEWHVRVVNQHGRVVQEGVTATLVESAALARPAAA